MKKIVSLLVLICFIVAFATPTTASANSNLSSEIVIITPDSFEQVFDVNSVDDVFYEYQLEVLQENDSKASVALEIILTISNQLYNISAEGTVNSYQLNNNDILWEGPIDSSLYINGERYIAIIGFTQLASSQESMISLTIQKDSTLVAISFGDDLINGSVLDFFLENIENDNSSITNIDNNISNSQFNELNPEDTYSPNAPPSQFSPILDPGGGGGSSLNLGENGEWVYQSSTSSTHDNSYYKALKSEVYFNSGSNILMVTLFPYSQVTNNYFQSLDYDSAYASLTNLGVELIFEYQPSANYAYIEFLLLPSYVTENINNPSSLFVQLWPLFEDYLSAQGIPTSTLSTLYNYTFEGLDGNIITTHNGLKASINIEKDEFSDYSDLDNLPHGLPFVFQLDKNDSTYIENTPYIVNTYVKYRVVVEDHAFLSEPTCWIFYTTKTTSYEGNITLQ